MADIPRLPVTPRVGTAAAPMPAADAAWLRDVVRRRSAIVLDESKQYLLDTRLASLARAQGIASVPELVARARGGDRLMVDAIIEAMTTNETSWFRDGGPFTAMRTSILPALARARSVQRSIRIWSAACSTGQEAYSVAMICRDVLPPDMAIEIVGTDLSAAVVDKATKGEYSQLEVNRGLPAPMLVRWMTRSGAHWQVNRELRGMVRFRQSNLLAPFTDLGRFDIVLMRNVLIYFDPATKTDILRRVLPQTRPDGVLVLGAAESALGLDVGWSREQLGASSVLRPAGAPPLGADGPAPRRAGAQPAASPTVWTSPPPPRTTTAPARTPVTPARTPLPPARPATNPTPRRTPLPASQPAPVRPAWRAAVEERAAPASPRRPFTSGS